MSCSVGSEADSIRSSSEQRNIKSTRVESIMMTTKHTVLLVAIATLAVSKFAQAQIVDPSLNSTDFVLDFDDLPGTPGPGGVLVGANAGNTPSLINSGLAFARVTLRPGGANSPHTHPRAVEALFVIRGILRVCFVEENGGATHCNDLKAGQATFFPMGTIHYQQNIGKTRARFLAVLTSDNPGTLTIAPRLFTLPLEILSAAFNVETEELATVRGGLPSNPIPAGPMAFPNPSLAEALAL